MTPFHRFKIGDFTCTVLRDGEREMPITRVFSHVPADDLEQALRAIGYAAELESGLDSMMMPMAFDVLHIRIDDDENSQQIMVDSGYGNAELRDSMAAAGLSPDDISHVIITHSDGDHIGGIDQFPNARFKLPKLAWNLWTSEIGLQRMVTEFTDVFEKFMPAEQVAESAMQRVKHGQQTLPKIANRIDLCEPEVEILPGIRFIAASGHRSDHMAVEIASNGETLLHIVDAFRHPVQAARPDWHSFVDSYPDQTIASIQQLMSRAAESNALVFGTHFPFPGLGRIEKNGSAFRWVSVEEES